MFQHIKFIFIALPGDVEVMLRMKSTIDEQRDEIRSLNSQMSSQKEDIDAVSILLISAFVKLSLHLPK